MLSSWISKEDAERTHPDSETNVIRRQTITKHALNKKSEDLQMYEDLEGLGEIDPR